jgi:hypothetical protein
MQDMGLEDVATYEQVKLHAPGDGLIRISPQRKPLVLRAKIAHRQWPTNHRRMSEIALGDGLAGKVA